MRSVFLYVNHYFHKHRKNDFHYYSFAGGQARGAGAGCALIAGSTLRARLGCGL
jgi:hypothetical protein